jgi:hypothetical protein
MLKLFRRYFRVTKKQFTIFIYRHFIPLVKSWYSLTMRLTKIPSTRVRYYTDCNVIADDYGWGRRYKSDPLNGLLDYLTHPSKLAYNAAHELEFGDCDDHAIFWCTALLKSKMAKRAWFCFFTMEKQDGSMSAHAICVYQDPDSDTYYWGDYHLPSYLDEFRDKWLQRAAEVYEATPIVGAMIEVEQILEDDTPVFGKITILEP